MVLTRAAYTVLYLFLVEEGQAQGQDGQVDGSPTRV